MQIIPQSEKRTWGADLNDIPFISLFSGIPSQEPPGKEVPCRWAGTQGTCRSLKESPCYALSIPVDDGWDNEGAGVMASKEIQRGHYHTWRHALPSFWE